MGLALDPDSWRSFFAKVALANAEKRWADAIPDLKRSLIGNPDNSIARYLLAQAMFFNRDLPHAREEYRTCLSEQPDAEIESSALEALAKINEILGDQSPYAEQEAAAPGTTNAAVLDATPR
jgi:tetratricopeptide (TPR) repeat protein